MGEKIMLPKLSENMGCVILLLALMFLQFQAIGVERLQNVNAIAQDEPKEDRLKFPSPTFYSWGSLNLMVNDTGDRRPYILGDMGDEICNGYLAVDGVYLYMLWERRPGGSNIVEFYFDVDASENTGYIINDIGADFLCASGMLSSWNGSSWEELDGATTEIVYRGWGTGDWPETSIDYAELKIPLSVLENPRVFRIVHKLHYGSEDTAPDNNYILIYTEQGVNLQASFIAVPIDLHTGRGSNNIAYFNKGSNITLKIVNLGPSPIQNLSAHIDVPENVEIAPSFVSWDGSLQSGESIAVSFISKSRDVEDALFLARLEWINSESGHNYQEVIPLTIVTVPNISLLPIAPSVMKLGAAHKANITVINQDPVWAKVTVSVHSWTIGRASWSQLPVWVSSPNNLTVELGPNSMVRGYLNVTPLALLLPEGNTSLRFITTFEEIVLYLYEINVGLVSSNLEISVHAPEKVMRGEKFTINITVKNNEQKPITAGIQIEVFHDSHFSADQEERIKGIIVSIPLSANITIPLKLKGVSKGLSGVTIYVWTPDFKYFHRTITIESPPQAPLSLIGLIAILLTIAVGSLIYHRKRSQKGSNSLLQKVG
jgi:hypothetical protein